MEDNIVTVREDITIEMHGPYDKDLYGYMKPFII